VARKSATHKIGGGTTTPYIPRPFRKPSEPISNFTAPPSNFGPSGPSIDVEIPHLYSPRSYQKPVMAFMDQGGKRAITVWHRRSGKDKTWLNQIIKRMVLAPFCGTYLHVFPKLTQGRRDLWDAKSSPEAGGLPFRAHFHPQLVMESSETEMQITLKPMPHQRPQPIPDGRGGQKLVGSIFQVMGTDKESLENVRGINAAGVVFSEYPDQDPAAWEQILEPVLMENGGWAAFDFTPKGKDHAFKLYTAAKQDPNWFTQLLTIEDTIRDAPGEAGGAVVKLEDIQALRARGVAEEIIQQEYYCSFEGYLHGTIYGDLLRQARRDGRVGNVPWISALPVGAMFDIGRSDPTAIWFYQCVGSEIRFIDYYANMHQGADHYIKVLREKPYSYGRLVLPHDARVWGYGGTYSIEELLRTSVCREVVVVDMTPIQVGIDATRRMFSRFYFDEAKCSREPNSGIPSALESLEGYRRKWDAERGDYLKEPVHDKYSHAADALRTGIMGWMEGLHFYGKQEDEIKVESYFDLRSLSDLRIGATY
jgi:phage terminase large subunit